MNPELPAREPKVPTPDKFNGNRKNFRTFMSQLNAVFQLNASRFTHDQTKIIYLGSLLAGDASIWYESVTRTGSFKSYETFYAAFETLFKDPYEAVVARRDIKRLKQGNLSATTYAMKFLALSADTGFNDNALMDLFRSNLNDNVKDVLATSPSVPEDFASLVNFVIGVDNRLYERRLETKNDSRARPRYQGQSSFGQVKTSQNNSGPGPMELDSIHVNNNQAVPRGPLSNEEKARRRREGLCLYCGKPGHVATSCPAKNLQSRRQ